MDTIPFGFCHCGCGRKTKISHANVPAHGYVLGQPRKFVMNHGKRRKGTHEGALPFKLEGVYCRLIPLSRGLWTIVDADDYEWLSAYKWFALFAKHTGAYYAARKTLTIDGKRELIRMHRQILGLETGNPLEGDHIYPFNTLDNRRKNLRIVTAGEQQLNRRKDWRS
jgi:hypothetical protein